MRTVLKAIGWIWTLVFAGLALLTAGSADGDASTGCCALALGAPIVMPIWLAGMVVILVLYVISPQPRSKSPD